MAHILQLNQSGTFLKETYSTLLLRRILTPFSDGYVDLQSPTGLGLNVLAYNYDGGSMPPTRMVSTQDKRWLDRYIMYITY